MAHDSRKRGRNRRELLASVGAIHLPSEGMRVRKTHRRQFLSEIELVDLYREDAWIMQLVTAVRDAAIPDAWLVAGVLRAKVWDTLHGYTDRTPSPDVDVAYFNAVDLDEATEKNFDQALQMILGGTRWSTKNQARMGREHDRRYRSAADGVADYPETATAIGLRLGSAGTLELLAPHGIDDLVRLVLRPNPYELSIGAITFDRRVSQKSWLTTWPQLRVVCGGAQ